MKEAEVFAKYVESGCESNKFEGFEIINGVMNPEGARGWSDCKRNRSQSSFKMVSARV